jgi:hypothetical protein
MTQTCAETAGARPKNAVIGGIGHFLRIKRADSADVSDGETTVGGAT